MRTLITAIIYVTYLVLNSATYSPKHPTATRNEEKYSAHSQNINFVESDNKSDALRTILDHQRRERWVILFLIAAVFALLVMRLLGGNR